jgi:hypothetical protein
MDDKSKNEKGKSIKLIDELIFLCEPDCLNSKISNWEAKYIKLTDLIAQNYTDWRGPGEYSKYIELSGRAIDYNLNHTETLDLNRCVATLVCIQREQHFAYSDVIGPRLKSGKLLKLAKRLKEIAKASY